MKTLETKQERALHQFEEWKHEILKLFLASPEFGTTSLTVHFMCGDVTRIIHRYEESVVPRKGKEGSHE